MATQWDKCIQIVTETLRQINGHEEEIERRKHSIRLARQNLERELTQMADGLTRKEILELGHLLYWYTEIPADAIARALAMGSSGQVAAIVGPAPSGDFCEWCGNEFMLKTRSERSYRESKRFAQQSHTRLCDDCEEIRHSLSAVEARRRKEARARQLAEYKSMPYSKYLETEHWQAVRKSALKRSRYRCQLCNEQGVLDVHHRTYERRGEEEAADVIVLCRNCHAKFHGKE